MVLDGRARDLGLAISILPLEELRPGLEMVQEFRKEDRDTPLILMGYYNPIYIYGVERFLAAAKAAGEAKVGFKPTTTKKWSAVPSPPILAFILISIIPLLNLP